MAGRIVLLSGPVGAGKSAVAKALVAASTGAMVCIEGDAFWFYIARSAGQGRYQSFQMVMRSMTAAAAEYARDGYEAVLDFSIPPWFLPALQGLPGVAGLEFDFVVVLPSLEVCAGRAAARAEGTIADYGPYRDLYADFDAASPHAVCDDTADAATLAARIREGLDAGRFRLA